MRGCVTAGILLAVFLLFFVIFLLAFSQIDRDDIGSLALRIATIAAVEPSQGEGSVGVVTPQVTERAATEVLPSATPVPPSETPVPPSATPVPPTVTPVPPSDAVAADCDAVAADGIAIHCEVDLAADGTSDARCSEFAKGTGHGIRGGRFTAGQYSA